MSDRTYETASQMIIQKRYRVGDIVKVHHVHGGYRLPEGLEDDMEVRVIAIDIGTRTVEHDGKQYEVPMACIDSGFLRR